MVLAVSTACSGLSFSRIILINSNVVSVIFLIPLSKLSTRTYVLVSVYTIDSELSTNFDIF